ncbi:MAG: metalloregulator ArsR/SmtB family transcription factor [Clostridia bacterium]|nr:metalloregulator ArsR/SmtB family transcription factor [Clostridia bacterium]
MRNLLNILKALSDETRLRILNLLYQREELCVCDIMETLRISQAKASRHLSYLKNAGLVSDRKHAQWVYYSAIRNEDFKFIESLISDNLSTKVQIRTDLESLKEWLQRKSNTCD